MPINMGVAEGHIDLDFKNLKSAVSSSIKELDRLERAGKLTQSQFDLLEAATKGTASTFREAESKAKSLTSQISSAKDKIGTYKQTIDGLNGIIQRNTEEQNKLAEQIRKVSEQYGKSEDKVKSLKAAYNDAKKASDDIAKAHGDESEEAKLAAQAQEDAGKAYETAMGKADKYRNELLQLETRYNSLGDETVESKAKITEYKTEINNTKTEVIKLSGELSTAESRLVTCGAAAQKAGDKWQSAGDKIGKVGSALTLGVTTPILAVGGYAVKSAIDFESAFTGVTKTVDGTTQQLKALEKGIIDMSTEIPSSTTEISAVAEAAGQLGIQTDNILGFTRTMIDLGNSTNLASEEGASSLAKFANITNMAQNEFDRLGSSVVDLGNNFATTERDIVEMGMRLAGAGTQIGLSQADIMGLATAMSSVGIEAEMGGSAMSKAMVKMQVACETGFDSLNKVTATTGLSLRDLQLMSQNASSDFKDLADSLGMTKGELQDIVNSGANLESFAEISGMTAAEFKKAFQEDATGAIQAFISGLGDTEGAGKSTIQMLEDMGFTEVRLRDTMTRLANSGDLVTRAVNTSNTAWEENNALTNEAEKRYGTTESKIKTAKNQLTEAARSIGENLLPVISDVVSDVADLAKGFSKLSPETQKNIIAIAGFAAAAGPLGKVTGTLTKGVGTLTGGFGKLLTKLGNKTAAKTAKKSIEGVTDSLSGATGGVKGFSGVLSKLASPLGIAALATTAIIGIGIAVIEAEKKMVQADMESRFGDIKLSAEEVEDVAKRLTTNDWTMKVDAVIEAKEKLKEFEGQINDSVAEMNKIGWKVGVGLDLTEEEKTTFKDSAKQYIESTTKLLEQQQYTVSLAIDTMLSPGTAAYDNISKFTTEFYSDTKSELDRLGKEYAESVNAAFADGVLTEDESLNLETLRQRVQTLIDDIADAKYMGKLKSIEMQAPQEGISQESFQELQKEIGESLKERSEKSQEAYELAVGEVELAFKKDAINDAQYNELMQQLNLNFNREQSGIVLEGLGVQVRSIKSNYKDIVDQFSGQFSSSIDDAIVEVLGKSDFVSAESVLWKSIGGPKLDKHARQGVKDFLNSMQPTTDELEKLAESYRQAGMVPPENVTKGLLDVYQLETMAGSAEHMYEVLAGQIASSPESRKAVQSAVEAGNEIPKELVKALRDNYGLVYVGGSEIFDQVQDPVPTKVQETKELMSKAGLEISDELAEALSSKGAAVQQKTIELLDRIKKGEALKETELKALLSNLGIQTADSLSKSLATKESDVQKSAIELLSQISGGAKLKETEIQQLFESLGIDASNKVIDALAVKMPDVQIKAIELLDQLIKADEKKRPEIMKQLFDLGVAVDESLGNGLYDNYKFVKSSSEGMIDVIDRTTDEKITEITPEFATRMKKMGIKGFEDLDELLKDSKVSAPGIDPLSDSDAEEWKKDAEKKIALQALKLGISIVAGKVNGLQGHAEGGIFTTPHIAAFAEDGPEAAIPLSAKRRSSALDIWGEAGRILGVSDDVFSVLAPRNQTAAIDYNLLAFKLAAELRRAPLKVDVSATIWNDLTVAMDDEIVGRKTAPVVSRILAKS